MTNQTAHKYMESEIRCMQRESKGIYTRDCNDCEFGRDDDLLVEVYGMSVLALEKQIPKKYVYHGGNYDCPVCGYPVLSVSARKKNYCDNCGQRIDWSDWKYEQKLRT